MFTAAPEKSDLRRALAISLTLHVLALWQALMPESGLAGRREGPPRPEPLHTLLRPASLPASGQVEQADRSTPRPQRLASARPTPVRQPEPQQPLAAMHPPAPVPLPVMPGRSAKETQEPRSPQAIATPAASLQTADEKGLDANGLRQYRVGIAAAARRFRHYAAPALAEGLSGTVGIRVTIAPGGGALPAQVEQSSGHPALDAAAVRMIDAALQTASVPESLRNQSFGLRLPVAFEPDAPLAASGNTSGNMPSPGQSALLKP